MKTLLNIEKTELLIPTKENIEKAIMQIKDAMSNRQAIINIFTNELVAITEYLHLCNGKPHACNNISLLFNPHRLDIKTVDSQIPIYKLFQNPKWINGLARIIIANNKTKSATIKTFLKLGINGSQWISDFPPFIVQNLIKKFHIRRVDHILDPCAGWGGRMIGVSTMCDNYLGFEPAVKTVEGLHKLNKFLRLLQPTFKAHIYCLPFEDSKLKPNSFNFAITSPPYYDTERYTEEETNSLNPTYNSLIGFFNCLIII